MSGRYVVLESTGRTTGGKFRTPVAYVAEAGAVGILGELVGRVPGVRPARRPRCHARCGHCPQARASRRRGSPFDRDPAGRCVVTAHGWRVFLVVAVPGFTACTEFGPYAFVHPVLRRLDVLAHIQVERGLVRTFGRVMPLLLTLSLVILIGGPHQRTHRQVGPRWLARELAGDATPVGGLPGCSLLAFLGVALALAGETQGA